MDTLDNCMLVAQEASVLVTKETKSQDFPLCPVGGKISKIERPQMSIIVTLFAYRYSRKTESQILQKYKEMAPEYKDSLFDLINDCLIVKKSSASYIIKRLVFIAENMGTITTYDIEHFLGMETSETKTLILGLICKRKDFVDEFSKMTNEELYNYHYKARTPKACVNIEAFFQTLTTLHVSDYFQDNSLEFCRSLVKGKQTNITPKMVSFLIECYSVSEEDIRVILTHMGGSSQGITEC